MIKLRQYQQDAIEGVLDFLKHKQGNPIVVIPTGGGKTPVMAELCRLCYGWKYRVIVLSHVKELIEQTRDTLNRICPELNVGVYSAGLKSRDTDNQILVAGIQSVYKRAKEIGKLNLIIVDEAHLIPPESQTRYQEFLSCAKELNPNIRIVGLTATPYRTSYGYIYGNDKFFAGKAYEISVPELIEQGYLSKIRSKNGKEQADLTGVKKTAGDYDLGQLAEIFSDEGLLHAAIEDIKSKASDRKKILVFCPKISTCNDFARLYEQETGEPVYVITGDTDADTRADIIDDFKNADCRVLVNCQVLTTGFDAPNIDCVVLLRATVSPGLYYQMVGRGFRICEGKEDCLILDYGGNIERHGPVDRIKPNFKKYERDNKGKSPFKFCPACGECINAEVMECPACGFIFAVEEKPLNINAKSSEEDILSDMFSNKPASTETFDIIQTVYNEPSVKKGALPGSPRYIRVDYMITPRKFKSEWLCIEYDGYPRTKFEKWFKQRVAPEVIETFGGIPISCAEFQLFLKWKAIAETKAIIYKTKPGEQWGNVTKWKVGDIPTLEQVNANANEARKKEKNGYGEPDTDSYSYWESLDDETGEYGINQDYKEGGDF